MKKCNWLKQKYDLDLSLEAINKKVIYADARINQLEFNQAVVVATEPFLGPSLRNYPDRETLEALVPRLTKLYQDSLDQIIKIPNLLNLIIILPKWRLKSQETFSLAEKYLDNFKLNGYYLNKLGEYSRPDSFIIREIIRIEIRNPNI